MVLMLVCVGLVVDVGHAMLVQRQLQAGVDAAALAGVQHLPDAPSAESRRSQYSASPGSKNAVNTVEQRGRRRPRHACLAGVPGCNRRDGGVNGIVVNVQSKVPTWFGRIIGIKELKVNANATAARRAREAAGHHDRARPHGLDVPDRRSAGERAAVDVHRPERGAQRHQDLPRFHGPAIDKVGLALTPPVPQRGLAHEVSCPERVSALGRHHESQPALHADDAREHERQVLRLRPVVASGRDRQPDGRGLLVLRRRLARGCGRHRRRTTTSINDPVLGWIRQSRVRRSSSASTARAPTA